MIEIEGKKFNPETDTGEKRPVAVRIATGNVNDKFSSYPSNGLTPRRLAQIFREADEGNVRSQMELFEEMEEKDPHLFSQLQTRKLAVTGLNWDIQPFSEEETDKEIAEFVTSQINGLEDLDDTLIDMLDAVGKGVSILELFWGIGSAGENVITKVEQVHPKKLIWDFRTDEMKVCTKDYPFGLALPKNKFIVHKYKAKSGHTSRAGILRVVAWMYLFKNYDVKDWVAFAEIFGMPLRLGKYDTSASEADKRQLAEAIISLGTDAAGIIPANALIEFIEAQKTTSVDIYERLARYCDEQISKAVLGQTLTSDSGGGSFAQSKTHNEVRHDLTVADAKALATTIRRDIISPLVEYNFGADKNIPLFSFDCQEADDQKEKAEIYKTLVCDMGLQIPDSHIYKTFNIPKPEEGEAVLHPAAATSLNADQKAGTAGETKALKEKIQEGAQEQIDQIVELANHEAAVLYREMLKPIIKEIDKSEDLQTLQETLQDKKVLKELLEDMEQPDLEDMLHQSMYLAELIGRTEL